MAGRSTPEPAAGGMSAGHLSVGAAGPAAIAETHISVVVFIADRAYKLKKPVRFPFVDLTTREARRRLCHREVELNRRLAPDVYLGVADVVTPDGHVADHLVVMARLPEERRLSALVRAEDPAVADLVRAVGRRVAAFHAAATRGPAVDRAAGAAATARRWHDNDEELAPFAPELFAADELARIRMLVDAYLAGRGALFAERVAAGAACDGHGDLQADDIFCLPDGPRLLDCIEFADELRYADVVDDVAFLAMDLERLGAPEAAGAFVASYDEFSGEPLPASRLHHGIAYRAQVRAKVTALRWRQEPDGPERVATADQARDLLALCRRHLEAARVRLIVVGGAPGTGKTTLARTLADRLGATHLRSDELRKQRAGLDAAAPAGGGLDAGLYGADLTDAVYAQLADLSRRLVSRGESVVVDATFGAARHRSLLRAVAHETATELVELRCALDPVLAGTRVARRQAAGGDASDATPAVAAALAERAEPWPEATTLDTAAAADDVASEAAEVVERAPVPGT